MRTLALALAAVFALLGTAAVHAAGFKVIAHNGIRIESMPKKAVSDLFMKRTVKWDNGTSAVPVDLAEAAGTRDEFSRAVHGKPTAAVKSYWNQQIFSGRDVPPVEKRNDAEVVAFVRATPGAVGYVSEGSPTDGVRVISVE